MKNAAPFLSCMYDYNLFQDRGGLFEGTGGITLPISPLRVADLIVTIADYY